MANVPDTASGCNLSSVIPEYLREMKRWTAWKFIPAKKAGKKPAKFPLSLTNDSATWLTFSEALARRPEKGGIGFMLVDATSVCGIDLDGCLDPETGTLSQFATDLLAALPDTYAETSPSGKGLRLFATIPEGLAVPEFLSKGVECYSGKSSRFLTVTGNVLPGRAGKLADITGPALRMLAPLATSVGGGVELEIKLPVPMYQRHPEWQRLFDERLPYSKLKKEWREYLETGDIPGGRSERTFAISCKLVESRYQPDEIFAVLVSAPGSWEAALDKRDQDETRARALIWADIGRAQKIVRADEVSLQERVDEWSGLGLRTVLKGKRVEVERSQLNAVRILTDHTDWRGRVALDITTGQVMLDLLPLDDFRFFELQEKVARYTGWEPSSNRQWWVDLIRAVAERNPVNPRESVLRALKWDGKERLGTWLTDYVSDEDDALNRILGRKWLISLVARWIDPGCKVDTVLILQGVEGARKNTLFEVIAGGPERVVPIDGMERDDKYTVAQAWIAEMPEASLFRRADRNRLKGFISQPIDHYRPPYAANPVAVKRGFVLVATANPGHLFNADQDGLRRFWPVTVKNRIDYERVAELRDQLLAEAVIAYDLGEEWWFDKAPESLKDRVENAVEATALGEAVLTLVRQQKGKGGMGLNEMLTELGAILGYHPNDARVGPLLEKHGIRRRRSSTARFWLHPTWARVGKAGEADMLPLRAVPEELDEVLS